MMHGRITLAAAVLLLTGCSGSAGTAPTVFAAASLGDVLPTLDADAEYSFDGSSGLVDQLKGGARADVFASADERSMQRAAGAGLLAGEPRMFATNHLVLIVPAGNPGGVTGFDASLAAAKLVICAPEVPCGAATRRLAEGNGLTLTPVSEESKVTDVLGKVASGEADAGLVYATDAARSDAVEALPVPGAQDNPNTYWVAVVRDAPHPAAARAFVDKLTGEWGPKLLEAGFGPPT